MENKQGEQVILFDPTPPYLVKPEMEAILTWTNSQIEADGTHPLWLLRISFLNF